MSPSTPDFSPPSFHQQLLLAEGWTDYELLDTGGGMKLERWGEAVLVRPDTHVAWRSKDAPARPAEALADAIRAALRL